MDADPNLPKKNMSVRQLLRQQREIQEKRKFGLAPLAVDTETQQEISPNIPEFISRAPWYYGATGPTLAHQRQQPSGTSAAPDDSLTVTPDRIVVKGQASRYTTGACKNCGARTHRTAECLQSKKKVGANYTDKVTGIDFETLQTEKSYSQKRDRFVGDVGVDLMRGLQHARAAPEGTTTTEEEKAGEGSPPPLSRLKREEVFGERSAQHGGVAVKELPKYLHNLDQQEGLFFDPKTGSMRANPNAGNSSSVFQGDLERYRSGDYYNYIEARHRFLTGESKSFVDFEFDAVMQREKASTGGEEAGEKGSVKETAQEVLMRSLYGTLQPASASAGPTSTTVDKNQRTMQAEKEPSAPSASSLPVAESNASSLVQDASQLWMPTRGDHVDVYGSHFDVGAFQWGYKCCKRLGKDAPGCSSNPGC